MDLIDKVGNSDLDLSDLGEVNSRCAVRLVHEVISRFDAKKAELVKAIGFGGLLFFPDLKQINRRLSVWLMSKVDETTQCIAIDSNRRYKFSGQDVRTVFGIPCDGIPVQDFRSDKPEDDHDYVRNSLGVRPKNTVSIKTAQEILDRGYSDNMCKQEVDSFKIAFVIFIMSTLLAPSSKHGSVSTDYWPALSRIDMIPQFDWGSYVVYRLLIACSKLKADLRKKLRTPTLTGCTLFLQILYLDSTNLGALSMAHQGFPRCRWFNTDRLRSMSAADMVKNPGDRAEFDFGATLPRPAAEVSYTWATGASDETTELNGSSRLFSSALSMVDATDIPYEAAAPIYIALLQHHRAVQEFHDYEGSKLLDVITSIVKSFQRGFFYSSPLSGNKRCSLPGSFGQPERSSLKKRRVAFAPTVSMRWPDGTESESEAGSSRRLRHIWEDPVPSFDLGIENGSQQSDPPLGSSASLARHPIHDITTEDLDDVIEPPLTQPSCKSWNISTPSCPSSSKTKQKSPATVNRVMSEYYLWNRQVKVDRFINLNDSEVRNLHRPRLYLNKVAVAAYSTPASPWNVGQKKFKPSKESRALYRWICTLQPRTNITDPWIVHTEPKLIELTMYELHEQITARAEMEIDFMDICLRRIKQYDDSLYSSSLRCRWRHFMESDFTAALLAGKKVSEIDSLAAQLIGDHLKYDVPSCRFIFFPAIVSQRWVCYAWDLFGNEVTVYDPLIHEDTDGTVQPFHRHIITMVGDAMCECSIRYFDGWNYSWKDPKIHIYHSFAEPPSRNRSGVYTALFCRCFDGAKITVELSKDSTNQYAGMLLLDAMDIEGNQGKLPQMYNEIMKRS